MGMTQVMAGRARSWVSWLLPTAAALWGSGWGCGGVVTDSGRNRDGGTSVTGAGGDTLFPGVGGSKPKPPGGPVCGNGILEGDELCDISAFRSDVDTCQEAVAPSYSGKLLCSQYCTIDTSACSPRMVGAGGVSYGGAPNGGSFGYAGGYAAAPGC
jgi:hypothetical protein